MKRTSLLSFWTLKVLFWAAICDGRHVSSCGMICRLRETFLYNPCCDAGPYPVIPPQGLCQICGGFVNMECAPGFRCKIIGGDFGRCVPIYYGVLQDPNQGAGLCDTCGTIAGIECQDGFYCKISDPYPDASGICLPGNVGPPISKKGDLCEDCGGYIQCKSDLCCRLEKGRVTGKCVTRSYAGPACDYRKDGELCEFCGGFAGFPCAPGYFCNETDEYPDAGGVCLPDEEPLKPPKEGEICGSCGGFLGAPCKSNDLYCYITGGDAGICLPIYGPGDTYGKKGGVCGTCGPWTTTHECLPGLYCEYKGGLIDDNGICLPEKGPPISKKRDLCEDCGGYIQCKSDLCCRLEKGGVTGKCVTRSYAGPACDYRKDGELCEFCGGFAGFPCAPGYFCNETDEYPDAGGVCLPDEGPLNPPKQGEICGFCGGFVGAGCNSNDLFCYIIGGDAGICLPIDGSVSDTYGEKGGVCDTCGPWTSTHKCQPGLYCEHNGGLVDDNGICLPEKGSFKCDPRKGEEYTDCGTLCNRTCENYGKYEACALYCTEGCFCRDGTVRRKYDDLCVPPEDCWWYD